MSPRFGDWARHGGIMSDQNVNIGLRAGWLTDEQMAKERSKSLRAQRDERQKGIGPPWTRDGREVLYNAERYRQWLISCERQPVREPAPPGRRPNERHSVRFEPPAPEPPRVNRRVPQQPGPRVARRLQAARKPGLETTG
jgi:hypothetical protein